MRTFLRSIVVAGAAALAVVATPDLAAAQSKSSRPTVAVLDLDFGSVQQWWSGNWDIGKGVADLLVDELVNDGSFRVIERKRLDAILAEQNFSNSERADPDAASVAKIGKALGVKYLIVGSITKFGTENKNMGVNGGAFGGGGEVAMGSSEFRETILGEATEKAVTMVTTNLVAKKTNLQ